MKRLFKYFSSAKFRGLKLKLYRGVKCNSPHIPNIGIYWTLDKSKAFPYGGTGNNDYYIYETYIYLWQINPFETFKAMYGDFPHEKEIVLKKGIKIKIEKSEHIHWQEPVRENDKWLFPKEITTFNLKYYCNT